MTTWKLQKLVYYCQAWSLVWDDDVIFEEEIEAWANGPVCPDLYAVHKGQYRVDSIDQGSAENLTENQRDTIDKVLEFYGDKSPQWLSDLTHEEDPWKRARAGAQHYVRTNTPISKESIAEYYGSL